METWDHRSCCRNVQCRRSKSNKTKATIAIPLLILNYLYKRRILKRYIVHMFIASLSIVAKCESNPSVSGAWTHSVKGEGGSWFFHSIRKSCKVKEANHKTQILIVYTNNEISKVVKFITESLMVIARARHEMIVSCQFNGYEVSVMQDELFLRSVVQKCPTILCHVHVKKWERNLSPERCEFEPRTHIKSTCL